MQTEPLFPDWLSELRRILALNPRRSDVNEGEWSDVDVRRYYDERLSPSSAVAELQFRELARS